ncbi:MAG: hypothetical protein R3Y50_11015 [Rikenellaceae bacterium]
MITGKDSFLKGAALFLLVVVGVLTLVATITTKEVVFIASGTITAALNGYLAYRLYKKWSESYESIE